jgi:hypothetical protein
MRKIIILLLILCGMFHRGLAQELDVFTYTILAEDVVQESINQVKFETNSFAVRWTYTEAGAKKMVEFEESHRGQLVRISVGSFVTSPNRRSSAEPAGYKSWKEGWMKRRTNKIFSVNEKDAQLITSGLKDK